MTKVIRFDWAMKTILRDKSNFDILEGFIGALLEDDEIKILELINEKELEETQLLLLIEDSQPRKLIVEITNFFHLDSLFQVVLNTSKIITKYQKVRFGNLYEIDKVISVNIFHSNFDYNDSYLFSSQTEVHGVNTGKKIPMKGSVLRKKEKNGEMTYEFVEKDILPEYYFIIPNNFSNFVEKKIDEWVYMFKNNEVGDNFTSKHMDKAKQRLAELNMTPEQKERYKKYLSNVADINSSIQSAEEKGIEKELQEEEKKKSFEIARNLKKLNLSVEEICATTGLSQAEIENL